EYTIDPFHRGRTLVRDYERLNNLNRGDTTLTVFRTSELCQSMGVWLEEGGRYLIRFDSTESFKDGDIDASEGFYGREAGSVRMGGVPPRRGMITARVWGCVSAVWGVGQVE